jgi:hypothetical protein
VTSASWSRSPELYLVFSGESWYGRLAVYCPPERLRDVWASGRESSVTYLCWFFVTNPSVWARRTMLVAFIQEMCMIVCLFLGCGSGSGRLWNFWPDL